MQGSCRPVTISSAAVPASSETVCWRSAMEGVGFMAARKRIGAEVVIPPAMPPEWLLAGAAPGAESRGSQGSFSAEPERRAAAKPSPNSTPLTPGMPKSPKASAPSKPSKRGPPKPMGSPVIMPSITAPMLSPDFRAAATAAAMALSASSLSTGSSRFSRACSTASVSPMGLKGRSSTVPTAAK